MFKPDQLCVSVMILESQEVCIFFFKQEQWRADIAKVLINETILFSFQCFPPLPTPVKEILILVNATTPSQA